MDHAHEPWGGAADDEPAEQDELSREWAARREQFYNVRRARCVPGGVPILFHRRCSRLLMPRSLGIVKAWTRVRARRSSRDSTQVGVAGLSQDCTQEGKMARCPVTYFPEQLPASAGFAEGVAVGWEWGHLHGAVKTLALLVHRVPSISGRADEVPCPLTQCMRTLALAALTVSSSGRDLFCACRLRHWLGASTQLMSTRSGPLVRGHLSSRALSRVTSRMNRSSFCG